MWRRVERDRAEPRRATTRIVVSALALLLVAVVVVVLVRRGSSTPPPHVHVEPNVNFALPPKSAGCGGATALADGASRLPMTVSVVAGQVAETVNVCIDGKGPFPFVIDTGAGSSIIATHLADQLQLRHSGPGVEFAGVGCVGNAQPVAVTSWSVGGVALDAQTLTAASLPDFGGRGQPVGLLGSDVLSRFGAIRIDFTARTLTLGGPEGAAPSGNDVVHGPQGPPPSAVVTDGQTGTTVPVTVVLSPGAAAVNVRLRFGSGPSRSFTVDTGSSQSVVSSSVARQEHLARSDLAQQQTTVCSTITVPLVHSGPWSIPGVDLHPQLIGSAAFGPIATGGTLGLLGSDQLIRYGWVVFDYTGGRLVLG
ncbi:MAG: retropepsin-like aspartic protease [Acidimicrobiales bacterium]